MARVHDDESLYCMLERLEESLADARGDDSDEAEIYDICRKISDVCAKIA